MSQILNLRTAPGYQVLATAGKTVLRPGGKAATEQLFQWADFQPGETVLELASGLGTSAIALAKRYNINVVGIEKDPDNVATAQAKVQASGLGNHVRIVQGNAFQLESLSQQFDYVLAEAILTMQSPAGKARILQGVCARLKPSGRFLSHELAVRNQCNEIDQALAGALRVNATPLDEPGWIMTLQQAGLAPTNCKIGTMRLLDPAQLLRDEGLVGTSKLVWHVLTQPILRNRLLSIRRIFSQHQQDLNYIVLTADREALQSSGNAA